jgi:hypothetical protein
MPTDDRPRRVRLSRKPGWRLPPSAVSVARGPGRRWGNPFTVERYGREGCLREYRQWVYAPEQAAYRQEARRLLRGKDLACWCQLGQPFCHADVLLEVANAEELPEGPAGS